MPREFEVEGIIAGDTHSSLTQHTTCMRVVDMMMQHSSRERPHGDFVCGQQTTQTTAKTEFVKAAVIILCGGSH